MRPVGAVGTAVGTVIENTATVDYVLGGTPQSTVSNTTTFLVAERIDVVVTPQSGQVVVLVNDDTARALLFTITNTGNGSETFLLAMNSIVTGDDFDPLPASPDGIFFDTDGSGAPWSRGQINTFLTNETSEYGPRLFANVGLIQGFQINEQWTADFGLDHTRTLADPGVRVFDTDRELSSGSFNDDFVAAYVGTMYSAERWSANSRIELRDSDTEERITLLMGWYREATIGHGMSAGFTMFRTNNTLGGELAQANLRFGWAYRPADSQWSFLNRVDLVSDRLVAAGDEQMTWRVINNLNVNRRFSAATQLSLQYAFKYVRSEFDGDGYTGYTDLIGIDLHHGFRDRWNVGINTSVYHSYRSKVLDYGIGLELGYNIGENIWLTLGYNFECFDDKDFALARYTAAGAFFRFAIKADQQLLKRVAGRR